MTASRTSVIGTVGELAVIASLLKEGYDVFREVTNSSEVDLIALKDEVFTKIQVKTVSTSAKGNAAIFPLRKGGKNQSPFTGIEFDVMALYILDKNLVLFATLQELIRSNKAGFSVRLTPPKNGAVKNTRSIDRYLTLSAAVA